MAKEKVLLLGNPTLAGSYLGFARKKAKKARLERLTKGVSVLQKRYSLGDAEVMVKATLTTNFIQIEAGGWQFWFTLEGWYTDNPAEKKSMCMWKIKLPPKLTEDSDALTVSKIVDDSNIAEFIETQPPDFNAYVRNSYYPYKDSKVNLTRTEHYDSYISPSLTYYETQFQSYQGGDKWRDKPDYCLTDVEGNGCVPITQGSITPFLIQPDKERLLLIDSRFSGLPLTNIKTFREWDGSEINSGFFGHIEKDQFSEPDVLEVLEDLKIKISLGASESNAELTTAIKMGNDGWVRYSTFFYDEGADTFTVKLTAMSVSDFISALNGDILPGEIEVKYIDYYQSNVGQTAYYINCFLYSLNTPLLGYVMEDEPAQDFYVFLSKYTGQDPLDAADEIYDYTFTISSAAIAAGGFTFSYSKILQAYAINSNLLYFGFSMFNASGFQTGYAIVKAEFNEEQGTWAQSVVYGKQEVDAISSEQIQTYANWYGKYVFVVRYNNHSRTANYREIKIFDLETEYLYPFSDVVEDGELDQNATLQPKLFLRYEGIDRSDTYGTYYA